LNALAQQTDAASSDGQAGHAGGNGSGTEKEGELRILPLPQERPG
jgi:hypothetical protein